MSTIATTLAFGFAHAILSVLIPGLFLTRVVARRLGIEVPKGASGAALIMSIGFLFGATQFLGIYGLRVCGIQQNLLFTCLKYALDFAMLAILVRHQRWQLREFLRTGLLSLGRNPLTYLFALAVTFGVLGTLRYPHTFDSNQLKWTMHFIDGVSLTPYLNTGAYGYSSLIYFPGVLTTDLPLVTTAAGAKPLLAVLLLISSLHLATALGCISRTVTGTFLFLVTSLAFLGLYGVFELGKDSVFGVVFSISYIASLISHDGSRRASAESAIYFTSSIIAGVITLPYLLLMTGLWIICNGLRRETLYHVVLMITLALPGIAISMNAMMGISVIWAACAGVAGIAGLLLLARVPQLHWQPLPFRGKQALWIPLLMGSLVLIANLIMPLRVAAIAGTDIQGNPIGTYRAPLDGKMTFSQMFYDYEPYLADNLITLGFVGMFLASLWGRGRNTNPAGIVTIAFFPLAMACFVLLAAVTRWLPLSGFNLWDLLRDIPLWYGGIMAGLFSAVLIELLWVRLLGTGRACKALIALSLAVLAFLTVQSSRPKIKAFRDMTTHMSNDCFSIDAFHATAFDAVYKAKWVDAQFIFIPNGSDALRYLYVHQMFTHKIILEVDLEREAGQKYLAQHLPSLIFATPTQIEQFQSTSWGKDVAGDKLQDLAESDEAFYRLVKVAERR